MENLLSTSYTRWLVTVVHHFHQLKTGGHVESESEHMGPLLQIIGRGSVFSVWLRCCSPLGHLFASTSSRSALSLLHFAIALGAAVSGHPQWLRRAVLCSLL